MNTIQRLVNPLKTYSFFLFGPRGTGKTTLLNRLFSKEEAIWIDLLIPAEEDRFATSPAILSQMIEAKPDNKWVVIDEVQKLPELLNLVHYHIERDNVKFALTGSSARKLKRGSANLLAGRGFFNNMHPFTHLELDKNFNLDNALNWGTLPAVLAFENELEKKEFLRSYALGYLKEEVWAEHMIKNLSAFRSFLSIAAQTNGQIVNFRNVSKDVDVDPVTVKNYFQILVDTMMGFYLEPYNRSVRRRQRQNPKFYLFDPGVTKALAKTLEVKVVPNTFEYGIFFEQFIILEFIRLNDYLRRDFSFYYLRTQDNAEIDLVIERPDKSNVLIEIKSQNKIDERSTKALEAFLPDFKDATAYCLSLDPVEHKIGNVLCLPWQKGMQNIFFKLLTNLNHL